MYRISEFSRITGLTVKALRYYDEEGILKPSCRAENSYRYYDDKDFQKARLVRLLRDLDFSIAEMKEILANYDSPEDLAYYLAEKKDRIAEQINRDKALMKKIDLYLQLKETEAGSMNYKIEFKDFEAQTVAALRFRGKYSDVGKYIGTIYKEVKGKADGAPFCCYYDGEYKEEADIEVCIPTKGSVTGAKVESKQLPKIRAISTTHIGSYETLNSAYKAIMDYAREHNLECLLPSREIYHKGPGMIFKGNPNKYVTEIVIPVKQ